MKVIKIIGTHALRGDVGKIYFCQLVTGFGVFYSDIDPSRMDNLCNHPWSIFRTYDKEVGTKIFEAWKANKI